MQRSWTRELVVTSLGAVALVVTALYWRIEAAGLPDDTPRDLAQSYFLGYFALGAMLSVLALAGIGLRVRAPRAGRTALDIGMIAVLVIAMVQGYVSFLMD